VNTAPGSADDGWQTPPPVRLRDGSLVQLFKDGEALKQAYDSIASARRRVCLEFYIIKPDATGRAFIDLLSRKAREGVEVFLIYDSFGSSDTRELLEALKRDGARVGEFHPLWPWHLKFGWRPANRDHRKLVVVDDEVAGVGGLNLADPYAGRWVSPEVALPPEKLWRDTAVGVRGPAARMFLRAFAKTWRYIHFGGRVTRAEHIENVDLPPVLKGPRVGLPSRYLTRQDQPPQRALPAEDDLGILAHVPTLASPFRPLLSRLLRNAQRRLQLTMAYFAPDDQLLGHLCDAARRGVKVQLMLPAHADIKIMTYAARAFYQRLLEAGVEVYERQSVILHSKSLCVDDEISIVGSSNLDYRSTDFNCEISAVIRSKRFAEHLSLLFEHDVLHARRLERDEWRLWPVRDRLVQWATTRLRTLL
jgi:cardiolipin synthase